MAKSDLGNQNVDTTQRESPEAGVDEYFKDLLEQSSLGTPAARQIREQADRDVVGEVRRRLTASLTPEAGVFLPAEHQARLVQVLGIPNDHRARDVLDHDAAAAPVARGPELRPVGALRVHGRSGSLLSFQVLGEVTVRQGDWAAALSRQQQHLLAVLVMAGGAAVSRQRLEALWDFRAPYPEGGVRRVAHELRAGLRRAWADGDPLPACDGGYRLPIAQEQADVLRFRAMVGRARRASGPAALELMRQALREWGPDAAGLHGGHPLRGLPGQWADSTRHLLRAEYRHAVLHCLKEGMCLQDYEPVLRECEQRAADDPQALRDEEFLLLWVLAAVRAGHPARAHQVHQMAGDAASHASGLSAAALRYLDAALKAGGTLPETWSRGTSVLTNRNPAAGFNAAGNAVPQG